MSKRRLGKQVKQMIAVVAFGAGIGCGADDDGGSNSAATTCEEIAEACAGRNNICVEGPDGAVCQDCERGDYFDGQGCISLLGEKHSHSFAEFTVPAGEEIRDLCQSWTLGNSEEIWVNAVEMWQNEGSHHSIWTYVPDDVATGPDGVWPCDERSYHQIDAAIQGGVLYAQSTQATREVQKFNPGTAIRIAPYSRVIGSVHLLNASEEDLTGHLELDLYEIPREEVSRKLTPLELEFLDLNLAPGVRTRLEATCNYDEIYRGVGDVPFDITVHFVMPHAHQWARRLFIDVVGGPQDGVSIINDEGYAVYEPRGFHLRDPLEIKGATGLHFGCEFENDTPSTLGWGYQQEMCQFLLWAESPIAFTTELGAATKLDPEGEMERWEVGAENCSILAIPWSHDREGGPGPDGAE